ncbi:MAG: hypothetical protein AB8G18_15360 [Gammaproteobacteria bacterium]
MIDSSEFDSQLTDQTRSALDCVAEVGVRTWPSSGNYTVKDDGLVHLFYVLDGIICCQRETHLARVLPREVLRTGRDNDRVLENPSRSDTTTAVHIALIPNDSSRLSTRHHYFSDDQKDNQLCRIAACDQDGRVLSTRAPVDVYLTTLGRYDTLILDRQPNQPLLVLCPRGEVTVNTQSLGAGDVAVNVESTTATVVGLKPSTVLTLRGQPEPPH